MKKIELRGFHIPSDTFCIFLTLFLLGSLQIRPNFSEQHKLDFMSG